MRLLNVETFKLTEFHNDETIPAYAIASHRWSNEEATYADIDCQQNKHTIGYRKVQAFVDYVRSRMPTLKWLWIDTCCIDKTSSAELQEAIISMFDYYQKAEICLAYLLDVATVDDKSAFARSEWFRRGWMLQELLAPRLVIFLTHDWMIIGSKGPAMNFESSVPDLVKDIAVITQIRAEVLSSWSTSATLSIEERLGWMTNRVTTREEDRWYGLFGIFGVSMPVLYGEKGEKARTRLLAVIRQSDRYADICRRLAAPNPRANHEAARKIHEPGTGTWLLQSSVFRSWKSNSIRHLWFHGKAGCGKTILGSTAIEDVRTYCKGSMTMVQAFYYFTFTERSKQTFDGLVRSLIIQLSQSEPGRSALCRACESLPPGTIEHGRLLELIRHCIQPYDTVFLHLDGLDECPPDATVRLSIFDEVENMLCSTPKIKLLMTGRDTPRLRSCMETIEAKSVLIADQGVNTDVAKYVATQVRHDWAFSRLDNNMRELILAHIAQKADGMFRWASCQLDAIKKCESTKPKLLKETLLALPKTLDETYERMLTRINETDRAEALALLRWITYARTPRTLDELAEATTTSFTGDESADGIIDFENKGHWKDTLYILSGLIKVYNTWNDGSVNSRSRIVLAHFSVQEYLESERILVGDARMFHLDRSKEHHFLAQSCLVYLDSYGNEFRQSSRTEVPRAFPMLQYAANEWSYHSMRQPHDASYFRELDLLLSDDKRRRLFRNTDPHRLPESPFSTETYAEEITGLCHAIGIGLSVLAMKMIQAGVHLRSSGIQSWTPLHAATLHDNQDIVRSLVQQGADLNACFSGYLTPLHVAASYGRAKIAELLILSGAALNVSRGRWGSPLHVAIIFDRFDVAALLVQHGADMKTHDDQGNTPLQVATIHDRVKIVELLK